MDNTVRIMVIKRAINKAIANGWKWPGACFNKFMYNMFHTNKPRDCLSKIGNQEFCIALWPKSWKERHPQFMQSKDPVEYLKQNLQEE